MKLSTRASYGTRALLDLAIHSRANSTITLKEIAERQDISLSYLEHIVTPLIAGGVVRSVRGNKGGITLAKQAKDITLKEIINLLEVPLHWWNVSSIPVRAPNPGLRHSGNLG